MYGPHVPLESGFTGASMTAHVASVRFFTLVYCGYVNCEVILLSEPSFAEHTRISSRFFVNRFHVLFEMIFPLESMLANQCHASMMQAKLDRSKYMTNVYLGVALDPYLNIAKN